MDTAAPAGTTGTQDAPIETAPKINPGDFSWKSQLAPDYANSPTFQKFPDTKDGFNAAVKSHLSLEQMLGKEKVVIPKDDKDVEAWANLSKALGVPDKPEAYGLPDAEFPDTMKNITMDKARFSKIVHDHKLTPGQAKGLWGAYQEMIKGTYTKAVTDKQTEMQGTINKLRSEWGDAYDTNVELGQMVINKFASDKETQDFVTAAILSNPNGVRFMAKIGNQFAENKIGEFAYQKFSLTPEQAQSEIDTITRDKNHPYNNDKMPKGERQRAIDYVNNLYATINRAKGQA